MKPTLELRWLERTYTHSGVGCSMTRSETVLQQWWEDDGRDPKGEWRDVPVKRPAVGKNDG